MSEKEIYRCTILQQVQDRLITQVKAAKLLAITDRQVRHLLRIFKSDGPEGLISKKRGKRSNSSYSVDLELRVITLIRERYEDFGPTFAQEKLLQKHNIHISVETARKWMIKHGLHKPKAKKSKVHQSRPRRECFGELIQIDASIHDWFEGRGEKCALIVFIDDATSKITSLRFEKSECLEGYFSALENHLIKYGRPLGIYSDRHSIFGGAKRIKNAQLPRALKELEIESILARTPQAKGRVERVNRTLQDRLIKEMRLRGISSIEAGNAFLEEYREIHNKKYSIEPKGETDTHRPLESGHNLKFILARREDRVLSSSLSISFYNKTIKILEPKKVNRLRKKRVEIIELGNGEVGVYYRGELLKSSLAENVVGERPVLDYKEKMLWKPKPKKPKRNHPWR